MTLKKENYTKIDDNTVEYQGRRYRLYTGPKLAGPRTVLSQSSALYPDMLRSIPRPPKKLYVIGDPTSLSRPSLAIIGARKATPYGLACTKHFGSFAAEKGVTIASGGAYGCDSAAHRSALEVGGITVAYLGGGCDQVYPQVNYRLFQDIIDSGGAVVSERDWSFPALPFTFRERNKLIAGSSKAVLIVEAGLPSGTFSTADEALNASRDVLVVPSAISSKTSHGSNRLLYQGATPVVDNESFSDILFSLYGVLKQEVIKKKSSKKKTRDPLLEALQAAPMRLDDILEQVKVPKKISSDSTSWLRTHLVELEAAGVIKRFPDGRYGPAKLYL